MLNIIQRFLNYSFALVLVALLAGCWPDSSPSSPSVSITSQPVDVSVVQGSPAAFSVVATGTGLAYQWQSSSDAGASWSGISGANASSYSIASTALADNGKRFRVLVSSSDGSSATSSAAKLSVVTAPIAPSISVQPAPQSVVEPAAASFSVTASGTSLAYQWQRCADTLAICAAWSDIASANATTFNVPATSAAMNGQRLRVLVSNSLGSVASNPVTLSVSAAPITPTTPSFSTQPANASVVAPSVATFSVAATGNPVPTVQWQISTNGGSTWSDIGGATSSSYSTAATSVADAGKLYRAIASNSVGSATSTVVTLSVSPASVMPSFSTQPASASVMAGQSASFTVAASGTPTPNLQWQLSTDTGTTWSNINGATGNSYSIAATSLANTGSQYRAVASNTAGSVNSNAATLTVTAVPASGWQTALLLWSDNTTPTGNPQVAFNANGDGMAVWSQGTVDLANPHPVSSVIWTRRYAAATGWAAPQAINNTAIPAAAVGAADHPQVVIDGSGVATIVWSETDYEVTNFGIGSADTNVWSASAANGAGWSTPILVDGHGIGPATYGAALPQVAVDGNGAVMAVWERGAYTSTTLWASRLAGGWSLPIQIGSGNANFLNLGAQVSMDAAGNAFVGWTQYAGQSLNAYANVYSVGSSGGSWLGETMLTPSSSSSSRDVKIAADGKGNAMAVWGDYVTGSYMIWANRYVAGVGWGTASNIQSTTAAHQSYLPQVAMDATGNAMVVWQQYDSIPGVNSIYSNRYTAGVGWGSDTLIETNNAGQASNASIGIDGGGNALVVWQQDDANMYREIYSNRYVAGTGWGTPVLVEPANLRTGQANQARVAVNSKGGALAVWVRDNGKGGPPNIWANVFK